ncbi:MAG TPA: Ldh family oxidoreductase [Acidobacteriota bacterium]|jgi:LDH2 family malate/lactate/ureidoglycolate dehydrogenase
MTVDRFPIPSESLTAFCVSCFKKLGLCDEDARITADNLIFANLRGVDSHGVIRLKVYADRLRAGGTNPRAVPKVSREDRTCALIDADNGVGQVASAVAMKLAISKAEANGIGWVSVTNSNHFGAAAFYAMMALPYNMIGLALTNASATMAPSGGREARLGNNPLGIAVPAGKKPPVVLDMATGAVARGKIFIAQQERKKIPTTWALDKSGVPTDDADAAAEGLIQPLGGYKGYGLSLLIDLFTGVLSGSGFSTHVGQMYKDLGVPTRSAHACAALLIDRFIPISEFRQRVDEIIDMMQTCPRAAGVDRIYVPGEIEHETELHRRAHGIPLSGALKNELVALGSELGVQFPL